jgi:hypothetical protein
VNRFSGSRESGLPKVEASVRSGEDSSNLVSLSEEVLVCSCGLSIDGEIRFFITVRCARCFCRARELGVDEGLAGTNLEHFEQPVSCEGFG